MSQSEAVRSSSKGVKFHFTDVIRSTIGAQITSLTIVYSTVYSGADQRKCQSSASQAFVFTRGPVNSVHKRPVTQKMFPFDDSVHKRPVTQKMFPFDDVILHSNISFRIGPVHFPLSSLHGVQFSCAINQPLLAHHWRVHQCLLTSRFIAPSIPWGVSAPGGKMRKQLLKDHNFFNDSPIFIIESSTFDICAFQKALHTIHFNFKNCFGFGERYLTP